MSLSTYRRSLIDRSERTRRCGFSKTLEFNFCALSVPDYYEGKFISDTFTGACSVCENTFCGLGAAFGALFTLMFWQVQVQLAWGLRAIPAASVPSSAPVFAQGSEFPCQRLLTANVCPLFSPECNAAQDGFQADCDCFTAYDECISDGNVLAGGTTSPCSISQEASCQMCALLSGYSYAARIDNMECTPGTEITWPSFCNGTAQPTTGTGPSMPPSPPPPSSGGSPSPSAVNAAAPINPLLAASAAAALATAALLADRR